MLDFKKFVEGYLCIGRDALVEHTNAQQFKFIKMAMVGHGCSINFCSLTMSGYQRKVEELGSRRRLNMDHLRCPMEIRWF